MSQIVSIFNHSIIITTFVFIMMLFVDYLNVLTKGKMEKAVKGGRARQYMIASFLGATPGCLGAFMNVSFYIHGLISFGAIVGGMIATSGDEAFVMLALFPKEAIFLFVLLFFLGIIGGWLSDRLVSYLKITPCRECELLKVHDARECNCFELAVLKKFFKFSAYRHILLIFLCVVLVLLGLGVLGPETWNLQRITIFSLLIVTMIIIATVPEHYLKEHIWTHIVKKHIWRVFLWSFFALLFIALGSQHWNLEGFVKSNIGWILLIGALAGVIPESGPHMIFVMMFAEGFIPFSVLLTSSIVQDGHGMLPLLSYTVRDSVLIKIFNLLFGLGIGGFLFILGF